MNKPASQSLNESPPSHPVLHPAKKDCSNESSEQSLSITADQSFVIGDRVKLIIAPPYFKTAEPMPMLRPPDIVAIGEEGIVTEQRLGGFWVVHFSAGSFLVDRKFIEGVA